VFIILHATNIINYSGYFSISAAEMAVSAAEMYISAAETETPYYRKYVSSTNLPMKLQFFS